jgi:hypothetical protein
MTTSEDLLGLVVAAVRGPNADAEQPSYATSAGNAVYSPGDWPTQSGQYPVWKIRVIRELKTSLGRGGPPQFLVVTTVRAMGEVSAPVAVNDAGATAAAAALWQLQRQFEVAVINSYPLTGQVQQFPTIDSQLSYNSDAETHLAGIQIDLGLEFVQGVDDFAPIEADDLLLVDANVTTFPGDPNPPGFSLSFEQ